MGRLNMECALEKLIVQFNDESGPVDAGHSFPKDYCIVLKLNTRKMKVDLITKDDLADFKTQLIEELKALLQPQISKQKKWLRSAEVRRMLNISPGTLQNLRINGTLPFTKVGSIAYYELRDIEKMMQKGGDNG